MQKSKLAAKAPAPPKMTKRQLSKHQREVRLQRIAVGTVGFLLLLALLVPLYGYWREVLTKGDQPIAIVHGKAITTDLYARFLGYEQALLDREVRRVQDKVVNAEANSAEQQSAQFELQLLEQRGQLLTSETLDRLIEGELIRAEAARRGLSASPEEIDRALQRELSTYPLGGFRFSTSSATQAEPAELLSVDEARAELTTLLGKGQLLTEAEVRALVLEDGVLREKLTAALGESVATSGEQVRARHILVETEEQAKDVVARLQKGEEFAALAKELSTDNSNKESGGELGWFPRGKMVAEFEEAAFGAKVGEITGPVKTSFGYHVILVDEKADNRPYEASEVQQRRVEAFNTWLTTQKTADPAAVQDLATTDKLEWAIKHVASQLRASR